ncbi:MAG: prepilin-type N-terminal cleavage/methylation domain-containing protein [Planctomycetota bacterium]|nr:prepilin-type N-terminal cleavage/methylation domain-containing protein [Planctomycetota bacterium]
MNNPRGRRMAGGLGTPKATWPNEDMAQPNTTSECYTMNRKRGFTLIELLTVMAIIALLIGLLLPALAQARKKALLSKDQAQIKQIHTSWIAFAREYNGAFPTPGLINRLDDPILGQIPGRGPEDLEANTSAHMYSVCIMQNYFAPQLCLGPTEPSGFVIVKDDYNWSEYKPMDDIYWMESNPFGVDLDGNGIGYSNASYAHTPIAGERKRKEWRDSLTSKFAVLGNRGVERGEQTPGSTLYEDSITLEIHGRREQWMGNIAYNDNHVEIHQTFTPEGIAYLDLLADPPVSVPDNLFNNQTGSANQVVGDGYDIWLILVSEITGTDPLDLIVEWD